MALEIRDLAMNMAGGHGQGVLGLPAMEEGDGFGRRQEAR
jgi:hypothetical protein